MSATAFSVDSDTAPSKDLNEVSADTHMATSLPGTVVSQQHQTQHHFTQTQYTNVVQYRM